jgi:hypothetical protein
MAEQLEPVPSVRFIRMVIVKSAAVEFDLTADSLCV